MNKFARQKLAYCYFSVVATLFAPELSDARISWAKNVVLTTVVDDFFDVGGSEEELLNLVQLVEKWDVKEGVKCCSGEVEIIFSALHSTICEMGDKAFSQQGRNVTSHIVEIREPEEGKLNAVSLHMIYSNITEEEAAAKMKVHIDGKRRELLRLVLQENGSIVPRACKDLFWKMSKVLHLFYIKDDGFTSNEMINAVKEVIHQPISVDELLV